MLIVSLHHKQGFTLIETLMALMLLGIVGAAIVGLTLQTFSLGNITRLRSQGTSYAEEAVEQVRDYSQSYGWKALSNKGSLAGKCYSDGQLGTLLGNCLVDCTVNQVSGSTTHWRVVKVATDNTSKVTVTAMVAWKEKDICRPNTLTTNIYNY